MERNRINLTELSERICAVEFNNQNLLKSYDRLMDKVSLQEGNMHTIKIFVQGCDVIFTGQVSYLGILNEGIRTEHWTGDSDFTKGSCKTI